MKKITFIALFTIASLGAFAQRGVLLGGNVAYNSTKAETASSATSNFEFSPMLGYAFNKNWLAGGMFTYGSTTDAAEQTVGNFAVGPFVRYTQPLNDIFSVYSDFGLKYMEKEAYPGTTTGKSHGFGFSIDPTASINVNKGFALNISFGGLNYSNYGRDNNMTSNFNLSLGNAIKVGVSKFFPTK